jgi:hypothetical protein
LAKEATLAIKLPRLNRGRSVHWGNAFLGDQINQGFSLGIEHGRFPVVA